VVRLLVLEVADALIQAVDLVLGALANGTLGLAVVCALPGKLGPVLRFLLGCPSSGCSLSLRAEPGVPVSAGDAMRINGRRRVRLSNAGEN
jgi:hypothetical protein